MSKRLFGSKKNSSFIIERDKGFSVFYTIDVFKKGSVKDLVYVNDEIQSKILALKNHILKERIKLINPETKTIIFKEKITKLNIKRIINNFDIIVDGSDNFKTKFLLNEYSLKYKKILIVGAISKFDGHIFSFNFNNKKTSCLKCFYQTEITDEFLDCESEGILGPVAGIVGNIQANEVIKKILKLDNSLDSSILIINLLNLSFRKIKFLKKKNCACKKK